MSTRGPGKNRHGRSILAALLLVAAVGAVAWYGSSLVAPGARTAGARDTETLPLAVYEAPETAPFEVPLLPAGGLPTRIVAASAGIDAPVTEVGVVLEDGRPTWETAWRAAGHHIDSARPGQPGNMIISGHVSVIDPRNVAVFRTLDRLQIGDIVDVFSGDDSYRYRVTQVLVVSPLAVRIMRADHTSRVTLITCTPDLKNRLVVVGTLI